LSLDSNHRIARAEFRRLGQCSLKQGQRQLGDCGAKLLSLALAAFCLLWPSTATAQVKEVRRVLFFTEGNLSTPAVAAADQEIRAGLEKSPYAIERYSEYTETVLFPREASYRKLREWYRDRKPDVIIAAGPSPIKFLVESHEELFGDTPIVFCGSSEEQADNPKLDSDFTGVWMPIDPAKTLDAALQLQPSTQHVVVVGGVSSYDKRLEAIVREQLRSYESRVEFEYLTDLAMPALLERLRHLSNNTLVLYTSLTTDAAGRDFIPATESVPIVAAVANAPVFILADTLVGQGTVGGYVVSFAAQGKLAAAIATRVLQGERPRDIPIVRDANVFVFDWRALRRWGLKESALPPSSIVLNRQQTIWESYKWYIVGGIALCVAEALLILGLLWQRARRRTVEAELVIAYDRLHSALESGKAVAWEWDLATGKDSWFGDLKTMFGIPSDTYVGRPEDFHRFVHPEDRQQVSEAVAEARKNHQTYAAEFRVVWPDGTLRWVTATGKFYYSPNGEPERMLGMAVDITDRKHLEDELHESEGRLGSIVASAMDAIIAVDDAQRVLLFNASAEKMFGCRAGDAIGTPIDRFIPERFRAGHIAYIRHFGETGVTSRTMGALSALWALRSNGQEFPIEASISHIEAGGKKLFTVIIRDITDRKQAERVLRESEERLHLAVQAGRMYAFEWDAATDNIVRSGECLSIFNWMDDPTLDTGRQFAARVHPGDLEGYAATETGHTAESPVYQTSFRLLRPDGSVIWLEESGRAFFDDQGRLQRIIGMVADVTARKQAEGALRESDERFRLVANHAPVLIWMSGTDKLCTFFNKGWLDFTGRSMEQELGERWASGVHADDLERCLGIYSAAFDARMDFEMEYRLRRFDGEYRWIVHYGVPRFESNGAFCGYIGSCVDITDRKLSEASLQELSGRLIHAQEEERARIARELHDDLSQRMALLQIGLEQLAHDNGGLSSKVRQQLHNIAEVAREASSNLHDLSHQLHPFKLDSLGLVVSLGGFCREFSEQYHVQVQFVHHDIPGQIPKDLTLCLFRIAQEALRNVTKHSGASEARVELSGHGDEIDLCISDSGVGFDPESVKGEGGLGLISMRERLRLVRGHLVVASEPSRGTRIRVRVPLPTSNTGVMSDEKAHKAGA